jgi:hypothetical protein
MKYEIKYTQLGDFDWLKNKYEVDKLSCSQIAEIIGCSRDGVENRCPTV